MFSLAITRRTRKGAEHLSSLRSPLSMNRWLQYVKVGLMPKFEHQQRPQAMSV